MVEKDFYKLLIEFIKKNKDGLVRDLQYSKEDLIELEENLDDIYSENEFVTFFKDTNKIDEELKISNDMITYGLLLWHLDSSIHYFECISLYLVPYILDMTQIKSYRLNIPLLKEYYFQTNVINKIYNIFTKYLYIVKNIMDVDIYEYILSSVNNINKIWIIDEEKYFNLEDLRKIYIYLLKIKHVYLQLEQIIEFTQFAIDSGKKEETKLIEKKINDFSLK